MKVTQHYAMVRAAVAAVILAVSLPLSAELNAATPSGAQQGAISDAHSAFDGIWRNAGRGRRPPGAPLEGCCSEEGWNDYAKYLQPWAMEVMAKRDAALKVGRPLATNTAECRPDGTPTVIEIPYPFQFLRTDKVTYILYEADYQSRRIRMNSTHPAKLQANWYGDSVGHWEGETLVVDTVGLSARGQLNWDGIPHTDALHVVERYTITAPGAMELQLVVTDPGTLVAPWTVTKHFRKLTETRLLEYVCAQNNRDMQVPTE